MADHSHRQPITPQIITSSEIARAMGGVCLRFFDSLTPKLRKKVNQPSQQRPLFSLSFVSDLDGLLWVYDLFKMAGCI